MKDNFASNPLRWLLCAACIGATVLGAVNIGVSADSHWHFELDILAPALAVALFFVIALDIVMLRVFLVEAEVERARTIRNSLRLEIALITLLTISWGHYFYRVLVPADA